jgi:very-short-patch-repair endonuclease
MKQDFSKTKIFQGASPMTFARAKELRKNMTPAERVLWQRLRNYKVDGFYFRRQHPIKFFIADFYCAKADLIIEIDGGIHNNPDVCEHDVNRTAELERSGITVIRFTNEEVMNDTDNVVAKIKQQLKTLCPPIPSPPGPSPKGEGGQHIPS